MAADVVYLKLGGSLITDKRQAETPRPDVLARLAAEIAAVRAATPDMRLIVGHGSGSFGHVMAKRYATRQGVVTREQWFGFAAVADAAARLNRMVTGAMLAAGLPVWSLQPGVALRCVDGVVVAGPDQPVARALDAGLVPLIFGDVALDDVRGGTIAGTEEIFEWLCTRLPPLRMVLAGEVDGIYTADPILNPAATRLAAVTPETLETIAHGLGASHGVDVTGGMVAKVEQSLALVQCHPGLEIILCSGLQPGAVHDALLGRPLEASTRIHA
jgi:isopentenyl phosphate kinase